MARIGTGTKSTSTFYRGDGTFATVTAPAITAINSASNNRLVTSDGGTTVTAESELTYSTYLSLIRSNSDSNFGDNSSPGGVNGIFISNSQSTNGVFSAITLSANDTNGTNQSGSLVAKSVNGGYTPEVHISQRTGNNLNESNIKLTSSRAVELRYQGSTKLTTTSGGTSFNNGTAVFNGPSGTSYTAEIRPINSNPYGLGVVENSGANAGYPLFAVTSNGGATYFRTLSGGVSESRNILPVTNNTYNLGSTGNRWANIYTNDLNLSNEGSSNDVDGTWGNYTIQEGESDLFLINKRSGKKYKFNLTEVN